MTDESTDLSVPQETDLDVLRWGGKVLVGQIPAVGGGLAELYDRYVPNSLELRRNAWREIVVERIEKLDLDVEKLKSDARFVSMLTQCSIDALGQHDDEIISSLLNAIESAAIGGVDRSLEMLFLHFLRQFTALQINYLRAIQKSDDRADLRADIKQHILDGDDHLDNIIHEELEVGKGLITYEESDLVLSELGERFMAFISSTTDT